MVFVHIIILSLALQSNLCPVSLVFLVLNVSHACELQEMLKERGVAPFSKWEKELPKIVFDPRFKVR